jgi:hypothetical protein
VDQSDRDTWTNQIAPRRSRPRSRPVSASPPSRLPLARLSPGASAIAPRRPLARLSPAHGRQRPLLARAAARLRYMAMRYRLAMPGKAEAALRPARRRRTASGDRESHAPARHVPRALLLLACRLRMHCISGGRRASALCTVHPR